MFMAGGLPSALTAAASRAQPADTGLAAGAAGELIIICIYIYIYIYTS